MATVNPDRDDYRAFLTNTATEQAILISSVLAHPEQAGIVFATVGVSDFDPPYTLMAEAIHRLRIGRKPIDVITVVDEMRRSSTLALAGGSSEIYRVSMFQSDPDSMAHALTIVAREVRLRELAAEVIRARSYLNDDGADPLVIAKNLVASGERVIARVEADADDVLTPTLGEFMTGEDPPYDWVIKGLLERGDRLILTGAEGLGKSTVLRQIAVATAAGVHPFEWSPIEPKRVLVVDCENGQTQLRRALRPLVAQARARGDDPSMRMAIECRPRGMDLTKVEDEAYLVRLVANLQPDVLIIGPVYRLHTGNPNDEETARQVAYVLDRCRDVSGCAVVLEAHMSHGSGPRRDLRPTGSSLWLRWPEFGYGMTRAKGYSERRRVISLQPWRGDRDQRLWPVKLRAGGQWPWQQDDFAPPPDAEENHPPVPYKD